MPAPLVRTVTVLAAGVVTAAGLTAGAQAAAAATPRCGNAALAVTRTYIASGAGHSGMTLVYRNATGHTCTIAGYPGLDTLSRSGRVLAHAARTRSGTPLVTITVRPGGYASAAVAWSNIAPGTGRSCPRGTTVATVVANTTRVHRLSVPVSMCGLQVHPTVAGLPGRPGYAAAQRQWILGSHAVAARTGLYLRRAAVVLTSGGAYPEQVRQLVSLISLPLTGLTPAQLRTARADVAALDQFFGTPGLFA